MNNINFDRLEKLLQTKSFEQLTSEEKLFVLSATTKEEYSSMHELYAELNTHQPEEISPDPNIKAKLDVALKNKNKHISLFRMRMPVYQSAAAAAIFFTIGWGINKSQTVPKELVKDTVKVVEYVDKPVKQIVYVPANEKIKELKQFIQSSNADAKTDSSENDSNKDETLNPEVAQQKRIAMANIKNAMDDEKSGISIGEDTILQRMMVTVY